MTELTEVLLLTKRVEELEAALAEANADLIRVRAENVELGGEDLRVILAFLATKPQRPAIDLAAFRLRKIVL